MQSYIGTEKDSRKNRADINSALNEAKTAVLTCAEKLKELDNIEVSDLEK